MKSQRPRIVSRKPPPPPPSTTAIIRSTSTKTSSAPSSAMSKPMKDPVEVYCRLRPLRDPYECVCAQPISNTVVQLSPPDTAPLLRNGSVKETQYTFKFVFDEKTSQKALFDHAALPLVSDLLSGRNGLTFTYGVTGSGKTFTMTGTPENGGILPRSLDVLFNSIGDLQAKKYIFKPDRMNGFDVQSEADAMLDRQKDLSLTSSRTPKTQRRRDIPEVEERIPDQTKVSGVDEDNNYAVFVSYVEIYNNYVYDLLEDVPIDPVKPKPLQSKILREDAAHNMYIHSCSEVEVKSTEDAFDVFYKGQKRRRVAHTTLNTESSRSHSVFSIRLVQAPLDRLGEEVLQEKGAVCISQLSLVDLAGSERTGRSKTTGDRLREAGNINNSLMVLRTCLDALRENQESGGVIKMVPYRDSKLTHLFKNFFDGEGKVRMVVCVNPSIEDYDENLHVMRFAELTQEVQITRPTAPRLDLGLTPGRRRANLIYKEAIEKLNEMRPNYPSVPTRAPLARSEIIDSSGGSGGGSDDPVGPPSFLSSLEWWNAPFPTLESLSVDDETALPAFIEHLEARKKQRQTKLQELKEHETDFRKSLMEMERSHILLEQQVEDLKSQLKTNDRKLTNMSNVNEILQRKVNQYEKAKNNLEQVLDEKEMLLNQGQLEKVKLRARMKGKIETERERMNREMSRRVRAKETEFQTKMWQTDEKLRALKNIVNDKWAAPLMCGPDDKQQGVVLKKASRSDPRLDEFESAKRNRQQRRSVSPQPITSVPVANPRHRRSRSASGDAWIAHNPPGNVELGTLLQPHMKRKKSVTRLAMKDVTAKDAAPNYVLAHQEQDVRGDVETRYYKGCVIPSAGGGAQVVFNDVETLKQVSPTGSRKRSVDGHQADARNLSKEHTDVKARCSTGIEGHGEGAKKYRS